MKKNWWKERIDNQGFHTKAPKLWDLGSWAFQILVFLDFLAMVNNVFMGLKVVEIQFFLEEIFGFFSRIGQAMNG